MSVNKVILIGNVGRDPEIRYPSPDSPLASFSLATNDRGKEIEKTEWHNIIAFGQIAKIVERYVKKGSKLYIEGRLSTREYTDRFQIQRKITEIIITNLELLGRSTQEQ